MTVEEKQEWLEVKYPLTIISDRYDGTYSGASWLAFPLYCDEVPPAVDGYDEACAAFWKDYSEPVGKGNNAQSALDDLIKQMYEFKPEESEDERIRNEILLYIGSKQDIDLDTHNRWCTWLEKQKEQKLIPSRETILGIWELGNLWKENPEKREGLSQLEYIQKYWAEKCDYVIEQKPSINIDQLKSLMLQYLQEAANEKDDSDIEADTDKWARKILGYNFEQKPAEWSEEDEKTIDDAYCWLCEYAGSLIQRNYGKSSMLYGIANKLKSLPMKCPKKSDNWKPSEEQMDALRVTLEYMPDTFKPRCTLETLQNDLKKHM